MNIGDWVKRTGGKWHLVESVVAEDAITKCGRRMDRVTFDRRALQVSDVMPLTRMIGQPQNCRLCDIESVNGRLAPGSGEDDASTSSDSDTPF